MPENHAVRGQDFATLVVQGRVWTGRQDMPWADAVAVRRNRIQAVGSRQEIYSHVGPETEVLDADDGLIMPGWIDSHIHLLDGGNNLQSVQLRDAASRDDFVQRIQQFASTRGDGEWITGGDWDHTRWGGQLPQRLWIDEVTPRNPVWIQRLDGHMALANTLALEKAGVAPATPTPAGGEIVRDEAGQPTGILRDNAMRLVETAVPQPSAQRELEALAVATQYLHARGVTSVHYMGSFRDLNVLRSAHRGGRLNMRVFMVTPLPQWQVLKEDIATHGSGDTWLKTGGLKGFVDGSLGSRTAAFLEPFSDAPADRGLLVNSQEDLYHWTSQADAARLQVMVHAIGDRAIRLQLDIFERVARENGPRDRRFRIEHAQHIAPSDLPRFAALDVIASMQPYHIIDDGRWAEGAIGPQRCQTTYALRTLLDQDARLALGSDWFVAPPTPLEGIYAAVTRRTLDDKNPGGWVPEQRITVAEALRGYSIDAAYAAFEEDIKGSITPGKLADMVIVDRDLFAIDPIEIRDARVLYTILDGRVVFRSASSLP